MNRFIPLFWVFLLTVANSYAQEPFVCRGDYYLTLRPGSYNELQRVLIDPVTERVTFQQVPGFGPGHQLNAMGYRVTDNFIYVIDQEVTSLLRIDGTGQVTRLRVLSELPRMNYYAGACTPDGNYLVISGSPYEVGFGSSNLNLVFIDLREPDYPTTIVPLNNNSFLFFDMAFDPFTGECYSYDGNNARLIKIDIQNGTTTAVGPPGQIAASLGTLFFDAFGNLYGYGRPQGGTSQNTLFSIDKGTGRLQIRTNGDPADRSDGCSCPFTIKLTKDVSVREAAPCQEVVYTFTIANASAITRENIVFEDVMPEGFEIVEIIRNPFSGTVREGTLPNELYIDDMVIPLGVDSLQVKVRLGRDLGGVYENQARIENLPQSLGGFTVSDDPTTIPLEDPTKIRIIPLTVDLQSQNVLVCEGDTLVLSGTQETATHTWQDGSVGFTYEVTEPGVYSVEARTACDVVYDSITVEFAPPLSVELGEGAALTLGDSFNVDPWIMGTAPYEYRWSYDEESGIASCDDCPDNSLMPYFDMGYRLEVTDAAGCVASDEIFFTVDRNIYIWIPNAFSPNGDGINDVFYVRGLEQYEITQFQIFSKWGQRLFQNGSLFYVENEHQGWNGFANSELMTPGVYVYRVTLRLADGSRRHYAGDVTLIR